MPIDSHQLARPVALATTRRRSRSRRACSGSALLVASLAGFVGIGYVSILAAVIAAATLVVLCFATTRSRVGRRTLAWNARRRARARRESIRREALCQATSSRRSQYLELRGLVEGIERSDPGEACRLELQELLDHFVELAIGHQMCVESLQVVARGSEAQLTLPLPEESPTKRRLDIASRRLRHREETTARLEEIANEIDSADDLIRLVAQRTACAHLSTLIDGEREIERRLTELDEVAAALVQISA